MMLLQIQSCKSRAEKWRESTTVNHEAQLGKENDVQPQFFSSHKWDTIAVKGVKISEANSSV